MTKVSAEGLAQVLSTMASSTGLDPLKEWYLVTRMKTPQLKLKIAFKLRIIIALLRSLM